MTFPAKTHVARVATPAAIGRRGVGTPCLQPRGSEVLRIGGSMRDAYSCAVALLTSPRRVCSCGRPPKNHRGSLLPCLRVNISEISYVYPGDAIAGLQTHAQAFLNVCSVTLLCLTLLTPQRQPCVRFRRPDAALSPPQQLRLAGLASDVVV